MSKKKPTPPAGWTTRSMEDILGPIHGAKFTEIWNRNGGDMVRVQKDLRAYLEPFAKEFEARGFNVAYLSYALPYHVSQVLHDEEAEKAQQAHNTADDITKDIMGNSGNPWN